MVKAASKSPLDKPEKPGESPNAVQKWFLREDACLRPGTLVEAPLVAALAQLVEHIIRNDGVRCSSHLSGTTFLKIVQQGNPPASGEGPFACWSGLGLAWRALGWKMG